MKLVNLGKGLEHIVDMELINENSVIIDAGGRIYPAKDARMKKDTFLKSFLNFNEFEKYIDPQFSSSFLRRMSI